MRKWDFPRMRNIFFLFFFKKNSNQLVVFEFSWIFGKVLKSIIILPNNRLYNKSNHSSITFQPCLPHEKIPNRFGNYRGEVHRNGLD